MVLGARDRHDHGAPQHRVVRAASHGFSSLELERPPTKRRSSVAVLGCGRRRPPGSLRLPVIQRNLAVLSPPHVSLERFMGFAHPGGVKMGIGRTFRALSMPIFD